MLMGALKAAGGYMRRAFLFFLGAIGVIFSLLTGAYYLWPITNRNATAASCVFGAPVGLSGHDTTAEAFAELQGSIRVEVLAGGRLRLRITSDDKMIKVGVVDPKGTQLLAESVSENEEVFSISEAGTYVVQARAAAGFHTTGAVSQAPVAFSGSIRASLTD